MIIYKATNILNGKIYIGQTVDTLAKRMSIHANLAKSGNGFSFHRALRKYGFENFIWDVIKTCKNIDELNEAEEYYIAFFNSMNIGYNLKSGGLNNLHSKKSKQNISRAKMGGKHTTKSIEKISQATSGKKNPMYNKHHSKDTCRKMSEAHIGKKHTPETKKKMRIARYKYLTKKRGKSYDSCY